MPDNVQEFVIARTFVAPRPLIWNAWTVPEIMSKWFGPKGFAGTAHKMDFRPGGMYHYSLRSPDGSEMWGKFIYRDIVPEKKLAFINCFSNAQGGLTRHPYNSNWPREMLSTITFEDAPEGTKVTIHWLPINPSEAERKAFDEGRAGMQQGWTGTLDQLAEYLISATKEQAA